MAAPNVVSIHPDPAKPLACDLKDILAALGPHLENWVWCVRHLDWLGPEGETLCRQVEAAGLEGLWISSPELVRQAATVYQTIEGEFLAFPRHIDPSTVTVSELSLRSFPASRAELAVVAVDGGLLEVFAKNPSLFSRLKACKDVREEDPNVYFS